RLLLFSGIFRSQKEKREQFFVHYLSGQYPIANSHRICLAPKHIFHSNRIFPKALKSFHPLKVFHKVAPIFGDFLRNKQNKKPKDWRKIPFRRLYREISAPLIQMKSA